MSVALTKSRCINALKCYASYALSLTGSVRIFHMPLFVSIEPSAVCQLHCSECPVGQGNNQSSDVKRQRFMPRDIWNRTLEEIKPFAHTVQFYFQGEPLLNKDLPRMIFEAHESGLYTIVSTNAQAMTAEWAQALVQAGLNRVIVSMDGLSQASYSAYRIGGDIEKCKAALRELRETKEKYKSHIIIELQCLRLKTNEHEWAAFKREYKQLGADRLVFKTAQLYDYENGHPLMPSNPRFSRYIQGTDGLYRRRKRSRNCLRAWSGCVITTTGEVVPCCYDKNTAHAYGNIMNAHLRELFANEKALAFRKAALHEQPQICKECWR